MLKYLLPQSYTGVVKWYHSSLHPALREELGPKQSMYYVYLLKGNNGKFYIGYSADLKRRLAEHKAGKVYTTKRMGELQLVYYEAYKIEGAAKDREKKLKQFGSSYKGLIKRLKIEI